MASLAVAGCAGSGIDPALRDVDGNPQVASTPDAYQQQAVAPAAAVEDDWLDGWLAEFAATFSSGTLEAHVRQALARDHALAQQYHRAVEAGRLARVARSDRLPEFSLRIDAARNSGGSSVPTSERWQGDLLVGVELDPAGRLAAVEQRARFQYLAQRARYREHALTTAAETARAHVRWLEARRLLALFEARLANLIAARTIIARGYRLGLDEALDLYLADSTLAQERANVAAQRQAVQEATARLQLRLVEYPSGVPAGELGSAAAVAAELPLLGTAPSAGAPGLDAQRQRPDDQGPRPDVQALDLPATGVPSELLTRRPDLGTAWYDLLAADAGLAVAHRARFPRVTLSAALGRTGVEAGDLGDAPTARSVAAGLLQPVFAWGGLAMLEAAERDRVRAAERRFLDLAQQAFAEVETALAALTNDRAQYAAIVVAERSATAAAELAFAQYRRGLVDYTTVLEAQRRAFDAQSGEVRLRARLLLDHIDIHDALGGRVDQENEPT